MGEHSGAVHDGVEALPAEYMGLVGFCLVLVFILASPFFHVYRDITHTTYKQPRQSRFVGCEMSQLLGLCLEAHFPVNFPVNGYQLHGVIVFM